MSFAPGIRLELRQQQSLVLTPQLQQAIRLLQMSNLELASAIDQEVAENPFLQRRDGEAPPAAAGAAAPSPAPAAGTATASPPTPAGQRRPLPPCRLRPVAQALRPARPLTTSVGRSRSV